MGAYPVHERIPILGLDDGVLHKMVLDRVARKPWEALAENSRRVWIRRKLRSLYTDFHPWEIWLAENWSGWDFHGCHAYVYDLPFDPKRCVPLHVHQHERENALAQERR